MTRHVLLFSWDSDSPNCMYINFTFLHIIFNITYVNKVIANLYIYMKKITYTHTHKNTQSVIQRDGLSWKVKSSSTHARHLVAVFQVLCSLYVSTCLGYFQISWIRLTFSSDTGGRPELCLYTDSQICSNWWFQRQMPFLVGGWMLKRRRNARCTAVADRVLMRSRTQILCRIVAIFLSTDAAARLCATRAL